MMNYMVWLSHLRSCALVNEENCLVQKDLSSKNIVYPLPSEKYVHWFTSFGSCMYLHLLLVLIESIKT
jgi:hypothetical protein